MPHVYRVSYIFVSQRYFVGGILFSHNIIIITMIIIVMVIIMIMMVIVMVIMMMILMILHRTNAFSPEISKHTY